MQVATLSRVRTVNSASGRSACWPDAVCMQHLLSGYTGKEVALLAGQNSVGNGSFLGSTIDQNQPMFTISSQCVCDLVIGIGKKLVGIGRNW